MENLTEAYEKVIEASDSGYYRPSRPTKEGFNPKEFVYYDRAMGVKRAEYVDDINRLKEMLAPGAMRKVAAPQGVNIWEDSDGGILIKVDNGIWLK